MGSLSDFRLRQPPVSLWAPSPIAAASPLGGEITATLLVEEKPGSWQYGDEIPIEVRLSELESIALPGSSEDLFWSGIEVRLLPEKLPDFSQRGDDYYITAALYPPSFMWYFNAPLRPGLDEDKFTDWEDRLGQLVTGEIDVSQLPFDPFETDSGRLVARLGDPMRPHWRENKRDLKDGAFIVNERRARPRRRKSKDGSLSNGDLESRKWFFGLCPKHPMDVLQEIEQNQALVERAVTGRFGPGGTRGLRNPGITADPALSDASLTHDQLRNSGKVSAAPSPNMKMAGIIYKAAILQALAGREKGSGAHLETRISQSFDNLYRDMAQRQWFASMSEGAQDAGQPAPETVDIEERYLAHKRLHPGCRLLPRNQRMTLEAFHVLLSDPPLDFERRACWKQFLESV